MCLTAKGEPGRSQRSPVLGPTAACLGLEARRVFPMARPDRCSTGLGCTSAKEAGPLRVAGVSGHSDALALGQSAPKISCPGSGLPQRTFFASLPRPAWRCLCWCASNQTRTTGPCPESRRRSLLVRASPETSRSRPACCCPRATSCAHRKGRRDRPLCLHFLSHPTLLLPDDSYVLRAASRSTHDYSRRRPQRKRDGSAAHRPGKVPTQRVIARVIAAGEKSKRRPALETRPLITTPSS